MEMIDHSPENNTLTVYNSPSNFFDKMSERAFFFDGYDGTYTNNKTWISCGGAVNGFDTGLTACSAIAKIWFPKKLNQVSYNFPILSTCKPSGTAHGIMFRLRDYPTTSTGSDLECYFYNSGSETGGSSGNATYPDDQLPHWVAFSVSASGTLKIYIDSATEVYSKTGIVLPATTPNHPLTVGLATASNSFYGGLIEWACWSVEKTYTEMRAFDTTGLEVWYKCNETSGTSIADSSGKGNTGTLTNQNYSESFFVEIGDIAEYDSAIIDPVSLVKARSYRAQIYEQNIQVAKNKPSMIELNSRLLTHRNDPT